MAPFHDNVIETCLAGGTLRYRDVMLEIRRSGVPETAWFDLDYSPILDVEGIPVGVLAVVDETTRRVLAARADAEERQQLVELFRQAPSFMAMLSGPDHRFTFLNDAGRWLVGDRAAIGRPVREAIPEAEWQGYLELLDRIYREGETYRLQGARFVEQRSATAPEREHYLDLVYQPVRDSAGNVTGIFVQGLDVTEAHAAAEARSRAEAELTESKEELQRLADALPVLISFTDAPAPGELRYRFVNRTYESWFGRKREEIEGCRVRDVMGDAAYSRVKPQIEEALGGTATSFECYMPYEGATPRFVRIQFMPRRGVSGEVIGLYSLVEDITDQKNAQAALHESEEQLRLATDAGEIGLWDFDPIADTLFWPPRVNAMFGIAPDAEVSIRDFFTGLHPDDFDRVSNAFAAATDPEHRALYDVEYRTIGRNDGAIRWIAARGRGLFDEEGRCVRVLGAAIDITQRKADEARLHDLYENLERRVAEALAERKLLVDVIDGTDLFVQVAGTDFTWLAINRAASEEFARIFGVTRPQAGDNMLEALADQPEHQAAVREVWRRAFEGGEFIEVAQFGDPTRDRRYYEMRFRTLQDANGKPVGAYQFVSDVTDRIGEQERLKEAEEALQQGQKMQALGQLAGGIAHDFNNLLGAIVGSLDLVLNRSQLDERTRRSIHNAFTAAKRGSRLTAQLLAFARAQKIELRPLLISELLERMRELLGRTLGPNILLRLDMDQTRAPVLSDPTQLEMAVLNLAINARDAMPEGGTLTISKRVVEIERDSELASGEYVELSVTDTGVGMPPEIAARAFDPFFTTKNIGEGTGLGLSQVYGIARQAGGTVRISSRPHEGTTVSLFLPRTAMLAEEEEPERAADVQGAARAATILVVDDDTGMRQVLAESLDALGYTVIAAASGQEGLEMVRLQGVPDLAIVDFAMPGMNGAELAIALRGVAPTLPILFASGYANTDALGNLAENGAMLRKPFGLEELRDAVERKLAA